LAFWGFRRLILDKKLLLLASQIRATMRSADVLAQELFLVDSLHLTFHRLHEKIELSFFLIET
jgi:hypothetical protein